MTQVPAELLEAVDKNPDSFETRRVLGDWLAEHGDPRGGLMSLQAKELAAGGPLLSAVRVLVADHLAKNSDALWGPLSSESRSLALWRLGYWDSISLGPQDDVAEILSHPSARFLRRLAITGHPALLASVPQLEHLEVNYRGVWHCVTGERAPKLKTLWLCCSGLEAEPDVPSVEELRIDRPRRDGTSMRGYESASLLPWLRLRRLDLQAALSFATIENFLMGGRCPRLAEVRLVIDARDTHRLSLLPAPSFEDLELCIDDEENSGASIADGLKSFIRNAKRSRLSVVPGVAAANLAILFDEED